MFLSSMMCNRDENIVSLFVIYVKYWTFELKLYWVSRDYILVEKISVM